MEDYIVENFNHGIITRIEKHSLPRGAAEDSLNWVTLGDHIELRRGQAVFGDSNNGIGKITGLIVANQFDGTPVSIRSRGRKLEVYNTLTEVWDEVDTTNILPTAADGEDISFTPYHSLAGAMVLASSPNSSIYKIMLANPIDAVDQSITSHRGKIKLDGGRIFLWDRKDTTGGSDKNGLYGSWIDKDELADYTEVTAESIGSSGSTNYTGTLAFKAGGAVRTCMYVSFSATTSEGTELFTDDRNGNLTSNFGGTGTINYATGEYDITFNTATTGAVTSDYYWEDATDEGVLDFGKSSPREAGEGFVLRQDDGGAEFQNMANYNNIRFCFHTLKTWAVAIAADDDAATQDIYRTKVGIPNWRAMAESGEGIYYVDVTDNQDPYIKLLTISTGNEKVIPRSISDNIDLSPYKFDQSSLFLWGNYLLVFCRTEDSTINNRMLMYHRLWKVWDVTDFRGSVPAERNGILLAGDSGSDNVFSLFDGFSDEESNIPNYWTSGKTNLDTEGQKRTKKMVIEGKISSSQKIKVYLGFDNDGFSEVFEIDGEGEYVDSGSEVTIGATGIGGDEIGGEFGATTASPYIIEFPVNTDKYEEVQVRFEAVGLGYASISSYSLKDNRYKGRKRPVKYRA